MELGDPWLPRKMRQYAEVAAAEAQLGPEVEKALVRLLAEARKHASGSWAGRARFWAGVVAAVLFGPLAALFVARYTQEVASITVRERRPNPQLAVGPYLDQVADTLSGWPDRVWAEVERQRADGADVGPLLDINAPNKRLRDQLARLQRTVEDDTVSDGVRREARARLSALRRRIDEQNREDMQWWSWVAGAVRNLTLSALNAGTAEGAAAYTEATGERRYKQWWSMEDARVRTPHRRAHGQVRAVGEDFMVGGFAMRYPGDPLAPPDLVCNCRCSLLSMSTRQAHSQMSLHAGENESEGRGVHAASAKEEVTMSSSVEIHTHEVPEDELPPLLAAGTALAEPQTSARWRGVLAPLGVRSGDNRMLAAPADGEPVETRDLPLPLLFMEKTGPGHDGSTVVGRIDRVWAENGLLMGEGVFDLEDETAREVVRKIGNGYHRWVSVRVDKATSEYVLYRDGQVVDANEFLLEDADVQVIPEDVEEVEVATRWRLMNAAIVAEPAFQEAVIGLIGEDAERDEPVPADTASLQDGEEFAKAAKAKAKADEDEDEKKKDDEKDGKRKPPWLKDKSTVVERSAPTFAALVASAGPLRPPADWFNDPGLQRPTPLTVTEDGRMFGHAAVWNTPHIGYPGRKVMPPKGADYTRFHHGVVRTREDLDIAVGTIVLGADHASVDRETTVAEAMAHYAHSGYGVAIVRAGEDEHGVWVSGAICPDVDELRLAALRRCSLSGDWRSVDGRPSFISALAVNVPGFPTPREQTDGLGVTTALVAAGALMPARSHDYGVTTLKVEVTPDARTWAREAFAELRLLMDGHASDADPIETLLPVPAAAATDRVLELSQRMNSLRVSQLSMRMADKGGV